MCSPTAVGIDLGTSISCVAIFCDGKVKVITDQLETRVPSYVVILDDKKLVGNEALAYASLAESNTIYNVKRFIGRSIHDIRVTNEKAYRPFKIVNQNGKIAFEVIVNGKSIRFSPEEITSFILSKLKQTAEDYLGEKVEQAVITVPANFTNSQREATQLAAKRAGLKVLKMINEPSAAALCYHYYMGQGSQPGKCLVFDFGGGTLDVSMVSIGENIEVERTAGDLNLGGEDLDEKLFDYFLTRFKESNQRNIVLTPRDIMRLKSACEKAKKVLSLLQEATVDVQCFYGGRDLKDSIKRECFEELCEEYWERAMEVVHECMGGVDFDSIQVVILCGGSSRIPIIQNLLSLTFPNARLSKSINPDEAVASGAAIFMSHLQNSTMPNQFSLRDVTPLSLGWKGALGDHIVIVKKHTQIPTESEGTATTVFDNQTSIDLEVFEGERPLAKHNNYLGTLVVSDIPPGPGGQQQVRIKFKINSSGILRVDAIIEATGQRCCTRMNKISLDKEGFNKSIHFARTTTEDDGVREILKAVYRLREYCLKMLKRAKNGKISPHDKALEVIKKCSDDIDWLNKFSEGNLPSVDESNKRLNKLVTFFGNV